MKRSWWLVPGALSLFLGGWWLIRRFRPSGESLKGRVAIVTGASRGIGRATVRALASQGVHLVLMAMEEELDRLQLLRQELTAGGTETLVVTGDITDDDDLRRLVDATLEHFGRIDLLVNNAGIAYGGAVQEISPENLRRLLMVNLYGTFRLTQMVVPLMIAQHYGHIVFVSSAAASFYMPGVSVYSATKAGILAYSGCLRRELLRTGVWVSAVLPSVARTDMVRRILDEFENSPSGASPSVLTPLLQAIDPPEAVARAIVDAVRYHKSQVLRGGLPVAVAVGMERAAPDAMDAVLQQLDVQPVVRWMAKLGA